MTPRATVIVPILDQRPDWLERSVQSAMDQSVPTEVCAVVSARTPDRLVAWLRHVAGTASNLRVVAEARPGFSAALNTGIRAAGTSRVGFLLSDDWLEPSAVAECLPFCADIVSTGLTGYAEDGRTVLPALSRTPTDVRLAQRPSLEQRAAYLEHFFLFRRDALLAAGGVDERIGLTGADDYDLIWTLLERGASVSVLPRRLYNYRDHFESRLTLRSRDAQLRDLRRILDKHAVSRGERARILREHALWFGHPVHMVASHLAARPAVGTDLEALVAAQPAPLVGAVPVSPPDLPPRAFRLRFADGRTLKGRALGSAARAATMARILSELDRESFARILARRGAALLEEWVDGEAVDDERLTDGELRSCGRVLGQLHATRPARGGSPGQSQERLFSRLDDLVGRGVIERGRARQAAALARRFAPARASYGLCHGDFCGENIVIRADGSACVIDNETVGVDVHEYDLARTWYRWPIDAERWREFVAGYAERRDPRPFLSHLPYWVVRVLVDATHFRLRLGEQAAQVPLRRLSDLLESW